MKASFHACVSLALMASNNIPRVYGAPVPMSAADAVKWHNVSNAGDIRNPPDNHRRLQSIIIYNARTGDVSLDTSGLSDFFSNAWLAFGKSLGIEKREDLFKLFSEFAEYFGLETKEDVLGFVGKFSGRIIDGAGPAFLHWSVATVSVLFYLLYRALPTSEQGMRASCGSGLKRLSSCCGSSVQTCMERVVACCGDPRNNFPGMMTADMGRVVIHQGVSVAKRFGFKPARGARVRPSETDLAQGYARKIGKFLGDVVTGALPSEVVLKSKFERAITLSVSAFHARMPNQQQFTDTLNQVTDALSVALVAAMKARIENGDGAYFHAKFDEAVQAGVDSVSNALGSQLTPELRVRLRQELKSAISSLAAEIRDNLPGESELQAMVETYKRGALNGLTKGMPDQAGLKEIFKQSFSMIAEVGLEQLPSTEEFRTKMNNFMSLSVDAVKQSIQHAYDDSTAEQLKARLTDLAQGMVDGVAERVRAHVTEDVIRTRVNQVVQAFVTSTENQIPTPERLRERAGPIAEALVVAVMDAIIDAFSDEQTSQRLEAPFARMVDLMIHSFERSVLSTATIARLRASLARVNAPAAIETAPQREARYVSILREIIQPLPASSAQGE